MLCGGFMGAAFIIAWGAMYGFNRDRLLSMGLSALIGCAGIILVVKASNAPREEALVYLIIAYVMAIPPIIFFIIRHIQHNKIDNRNELARFYNECVKNNILSCKSEKDRQRATLVAKKAGLYYKDIGDLFNKARQCYQEKSKDDALQKQQNELLSLQKTEKAQYRALNEFAEYTGRHKRITMLKKEYDAVLKKTEAMDRAISMTLSPQLEEEHDWAVMGGIASGLAGPSAGIATAVNAQIENAQIRARNEARLQASSGIRTNMALEGLYQEQNLRKRADHLKACINATETKLLGKDSPKKCLGMLCFEKAKVVVSKTGTCTVDTKVKLNRPKYYIFNDVKATIDGTIQAEIYDGNSKIGTANLVLPVYGVPDDNMVAVKGMCLFCGQPEKHYSVKFNAENLWAMEQ